MDEIPVPERWHHAFADVVHRVIARDFDGLNRDGLLDPVHASRPSQIAHWIDRYPGTLVDLPEAAWATADCSPVQDRPGAWWVVVDLWTAEEGRSDLTLEAYVIEDGGEVRVVVYDVHVL
ncbi:MAG: hypothetical protein AB7O74_16185 [Candidatus Nanopelagicales bacterium]